MKTIGNLCRIKEWNESRRLVTGTPNYWLVWSERRYAEKTTRDGRTRQKRRKKCSQWFWGGKESDGSVEEQTGEDFCEPPSKQPKNPDRILLHVPRNIASTSQVVMTADRHKISSNALNDIIASIIRESQGCVQDFVLSQMSTLRGRKKLRSLKLESAKENFWPGWMIITSQFTGRKSYWNAEKPILTSRGPTQEFLILLWFYAPTSLIFMLFLWYFP